MEARLNILHTRVWRMQQIRKTKQEGVGRPVQVVSRPGQVIGQPLFVVGQPGQKVQLKTRWSAAHIGGLPGEYNSVMIWETSNCGPNVRETSFPIRKLVGEERKVVSKEKAGLQG